MTQPNSLPPNPESETSPHRLWPIVLKLGAGFGGIVLAGGAAAFLWGDDLINQQVIPRLETTLEATLDRPLEIGSLERLTFTGFRLGPSTLPPTEEVQTEASIQALDVSFNWSDLIFDRTLRPSLTLIEPDVNLVQAADGRWIDLTLPDPEEDKTEGPIRFELDQVRVQDARISVDSEVPRPNAVVAAEPILLEGVEARATFISPKQQDLQEVTFEVAGQLDGGNFEAKGNGRLEEQAFNVSLQTTDVPTTGVNLFLPPELGVAAGTLNSNLTAELRLKQKDQLGTAQGTARLRNGNVRVSQLDAPIRDINASLRFQGDRVLLEETGLQVGEIPLMAAGTVDLQTGYDLTAAIPAISIETITELLEVDLPVAAAGDFQFEGTVTGALDQPRLTGRLENLGTVQADQVTVETLSATFAATPAQFDLQTLRIIPTEGGFITANGQVNLTELENPALEFDLQADLPGDALAANYGVSLPGQAVIGSVQADGQIRGTLRDPQAAVQFQLTESTYPGQGELTYRDNTLVVDKTQFQVEGGTINATATARLDPGNWSAELTTANVPVNRFTDQAEGLLTATVVASGNLNTLDLQDLQASGTAQITDAVVALTPASPPLLEPGDWRTSFRWAGDGVEIERFTAPGVTAAGFIATDLEASPPVEAVDLAVQLNRYDLSRLAQLAPAPVAAQLTVAGLASFDGQITGPLQELQLAGNAQLDDLALNTFAFDPQLSGPIDISLAQGGTIALRGEADRILATLDDDLLPSQFDLRLGDITAQGELIDRQLTADLQNFPIEALGLAPAEAVGLGPLAGTLNASVIADLSDFADPAAQGTVAVTSPALGDIVADRFEAQFSYGDGLAQLIQGDLQFANSQYLLTGQVNLAVPTPDYVAQLDIVSGNFEDLLSTLDWSTFTDIGFSGDVAGTADAEALPVTAAALPPTTFLEQLEAFARFMVSHEQQADQTEIALPPLEDLQGSFSGTIAVQGQGFSPDAIQASADLQGQDWVWGGLLTCADNAPAESDSIDLEASIAPAADCNQFQLAARYEQGAFMVEPLVFRTSESLVSFEGRGNLEALDGQLVVEGIPVGIAEAFTDLPIEVEGDLDATVELAGSLTDPLLTGELAVIDPSLNQQSLESVELDFAYKNAVLSFDGAAVVVDPAELTLQGSVPYALPFMTVQPPSDRIDILVALEDESLQVVNLVTDDLLRWEDGQGAISLQVGGTLADPAVVGRAEFQDGQLTSSALSQPVTALTGEVLFNLDRVQIDRLQADFGEGTIVVDGRLPLQAGGTVVSQAGTKQDQETGESLAIALNQVNIDYEGFIEAQINGQVLIGGAVLDPIVSGNLQVGKGLVKANRLLSKLGSLPNSDLDVPTDTDTPDNEPLPAYIEAYNSQIDGFDLPDPETVSALNGPLDRVRLNNFTINLADELLISGQPFYNLAASGNLRVDGTFDNLQPDGVITLDSGWINLFSTQFRLQSGEANTATFSPQQGLDPFLNVKMRARVQDSDISQVPKSTTFTSAEISDASNISSFGEVEFVTVYATAYGYASELQNTESPSQATELITLTSRPSRSQDELLALLGSSVVTNIYSASLTQLAGFVGSGALAGFGEQIADTVGLRSFSIFPTTDTATESTAGVGIGVEAAFDIGENISIDALEILNSGNPPKVGLSYRFNNQLRARGTTNFSGDETLSVEYEIRF